MARCAAKDGKASVFFEKATGTKAIKLAVATLTLERVEGKRMPRKQQLTAQRGAVSMRLKSFRVRVFRNIIDSGDIKVDGNT